jgi:type I restriction-modification system DNA methylase subunit
MLSNIPDNNFEDKTKTFIDPACGNGQFLSEVLIKKLEFGIDFETALKTIYGIDIMLDNIKVCRNRLLCGQEEYRYIVDKNIVCDDALTFNYDTFTDWSIK